MNRVVLLALLAVLIGGCESEEQRISEYVCDARQLASLAKEVALCRDSGFYGSNCYSSLRPANCTKIAEAISNE